MKYILDSKNLSGEKIKHIQRIDFFYFELIDLPIFQHPNCRLMFVFKPFMHRMLNWSAQPSDVVLMQSISSNMEYTKSKR